MHSKNNYRKFIFFISLSLMVTFCYLIIRLGHFIIADNPWYDKVLAAVLIVAELFGLMHTVGYFSTVIYLFKGGKENIARLKPPQLESYPPIAVLVPSYKEPIHILHDTLICFYNLTYPNKHLYLLDDTRYDRPWDTPEKVQAYKQSVEEMCRWIGVNLFRRKWRGAKAGIINDFLQFKQGIIPENLWDPLESTCRHASLSIL